MRWGRSTVEENLLQGKLHPQTATVTVTIINNEADRDGPMGKTETTAGAENLTKGGDDSYRLSEGN